MQTGTVKWFDAAKGFGFIIPQDGGTDIVNAQVVQKAKIAHLDPGSVVSFSLGGKGGKAYVESITLMSIPPVPSPVISKSAKPPTIRPTVDDEDEFEREWGLRRA